jgi:hypothetical protein
MKITNDIRTPMDVKNVNEMMKKEKKKWLAHIWWSTIQL